MRSMRLSMAIAAQTSFSTMLLGMGRGDRWLPVLMILAAGASLLLTDSLGWFRLHRILANVAMVLAALFSLGGFFGSSSLDQLLAIARLLTYVQMVLLFQEKNSRIYGQLTVFSLLQAVVASLLNDSLEFGILLLMYIAVAIFCGALFFAYREVQRTGAVFRPRRWFRRRAGEGHASAAATAHGGPPTIDVVDPPAALLSAVLTRQLAAPLLGLVVATLTFTGVFFYAAPRTGDANWEGGSALRNVMGFSSDVSFDMMGELLQSKARVMRVSLSNVKTGEVYTVVRDPYFRGTALNVYKEGLWFEGDSDSTADVRLSPPPDARDLVRQDVLLEPTGSDQLFSLFPAYAADGAIEGLRISLRNRRLYRVGLTARESHDEFRYSVVTTAFRYGAQFPVAPYHSPLTLEQDRKQLADRKTLLAFLDTPIDRPDAFQQLIALADQVVREKASTGNHYEKAKALEAFFLEKDRFTYSLRLDEIQARRRPGVDPMEDFVSHHRTGHCQYFASALTLMLRSQGIPARLVVGYKGGEYNYVGDYFVVRQEHAHAWVEAYLAPEEIPADEICPEERHAGGGWLRLDPTPSSDEEAPRPSLFDRAIKSFDYARWLWNDYVLRLTARRQQESFLRPLAPDYEIPMADLLSLKAWTRWGRNGDQAGLAPARSGPFSLWAAGFAVLFGGLLYGGYRLVRFCWPLLARAVRARRSVPARARRRVVAFYQQLESILARLGVRREPGQTQRELARAAATVLAASRAPAAAAAIPEAVVELFYRVRFGHWIPSEQQQAEIAAQLQQLERLVLTRAPRR